MHVTLEKLSRSQVKLLIEVPIDRMFDFQKMAAERVSKEVTIPGFRPGQAPVDIVEKHIGKEALESEVLRIALPQTYAEAIKSQNLAPIAVPKLEITSKMPLKYAAIIALMPEISVDGYEKIKIPKKEMSVVAEEIDEILKNAQKDSATFRPRQGGAAKGDRMEIDFEGFDQEGKPIEQLKSKNHPFILGENTLIAEFEQELFGMKPSDEKDFSIPFKADHRSPVLKGKTVKFHVKVGKVEETLLPEIDELFVERLAGEKMAVETFKQKVGENLKRRKEDQELARRENEFLGELLKKAKIEVPDILTEEEISYMLEELKAELKEQGIPYDKYLEGIKKTEDAMKKEWTKEAENRVKMRLILYHVFHKENIAVSEEELNQQIELMVSSYSETEQPKMIDAAKSDQNFKAQIRNRLMLAKLFQKYL